MMNMIRADIFRILRGKALYITFAAVLALNILMVATSEPAGVSIGVNDQERYEEQESVIFNGLNIVEILYTNMNNMSYFILPLLILVIAPMFSNGSVKNGLSRGMSRTKLYIEKLLLSSGLSLLLMLFYIASGVLIATILRGYGGPPPDGYWQNIIKTCSSQFFMMLSLNCVGTFLVFVSKRTSVVIGAYIAFTIVPAFIIMALMNSDPAFIRFYDFDIQNIISKFGFFEALEPSDFVKSFATGAFYIIATIVAGTALFKKAEIK